MLAAHRLVGPFDSRVAPPELKSQVDRSPLSGPCQRHIDRAVVVNANDVPGAGLARPLTDRIERSDRSREGFVDSSTNRPQGNNETRLTPAQTDREGILFVAGLRRADGKRAI